MLVIPGRPKAEPGIHNHQSRGIGAEIFYNGREYGFRVRCFAAPRNDASPPVIAKLVRRRAGMLAKEAGEVRGV